ncbi:DUF4340 domain-containing protein [Methylophaga sp. OBS4]|uniref:DUF4340 domain-containing protein n=1 Tax=Methylophaga sp. OBS4 TaxID=2991935 RepID=UPI002255773D|nr:DUF4340 domain-containing protein [Methylophaga sp. OBS4]MCX4187473.1 DUF4340 domain-containing protein [Methylophaga sp. OBS4]
MTKKLNSLTILFIITVVMVLLALVSIYRAEDSTDDFTLLFPDLYEQLSQVDNIKFNSSEDEFTLYREGEDWFIREYYNYPANFDDVKRMLIDMSEAKILERKTANPDEHVVLGVEGAEPEVPGGESLQVTLLDDNEEVAGLIVGNQREVTSLTGPKQFYVRRTGEERAWLAEGYLQISPVMLNWIQGEVINLARERIARVEIIQPAGDKAVLVNLGEKDKFGTPESRDRTVFKYEQLGYDIAGALHQLRMEEVQPVAEFSRGDAEVVTARFFTFDGLVVTAETSFNDGFYYATFSAEYDASAVKQAPEDIQKLEVLKTAEQVRAEVAKLNEKLQPWVYRVSGFVGTNLMRARADMVTERSNVIPMPPDMTGFGPR